MGESKENTYGGWGPTPGMKGNGINMNGGVNPMEIQLRSGYFGVRANGTPKSWWYVRSETYVSTMGRGHSRKKS